MSDAVPESAELRDEAFWRAGGGFQWCWPMFLVTTPADTRPRAVLNRYPHNVIGAGVVLFGRCWGVNWKRTARYKRATYRRIQREERVKRRQRKRERAQKEKNA